MFIINYFVNFYFILLVKNKYVICSWLFVLKFYYYFLFLTLIIIKSRAARATR